ncbi:hypothetical protein [Stenotrophomonas sp. S39]|uniref:hypothetical protein n=1 Tax=Stenotrophomonas sp. S39 TaxID=2767451 RepID=UPI00190D8530|nr:hypothetical protein [Stenotrophomonas sp. S39]MBK0056707.1 hypothetical protein [Stenotrophomonas sp. S39]
MATAEGWFYAADDDSARKAAGDAATAVSAFQRHFSAEVPFGAVILSAALPRQARDAFQSGHALPWVRVWASPAEKNTLLRESLRRTQPELSAAAVEQRVSRASRSTGDVLPHEIGHSLYQARFWPGQTADGSLHYATPAPDWLDEAAAILMEPPSMLAERRRQYRALLGTPSPHVQDLPRFLQAPHPVDAARRAALSGSGSSSASGLTVMTARGDTGAALAAFYLQSLALADFLIERSGRQDVLGQISLALANGQSFDDWLAQSGPPLQLGSDVATLTQHWQAWVNALTLPTEQAPAQ